MPAAKFQAFSGMTPRVSAELLPASAAQEAVNCSLASGDITPAGVYLDAVPAPTGFGAALRDTARTLYGFRNPANDSELLILAWDSDANYTLGPLFASGADQLLYYTDNTGARMTTYRRALRMGAPYPKNSYKLGIPLPDIKLKVEATDKKVPGYDDTSLPGVKEIPTIRSYVFTYFSSLYPSWESIASDPSDPIEVVEGTVCKVRGIPYEPPLDGTQDLAHPIGGVNIYRTVTSISGTDFFKVVTLPFYCPIASITIDGDKQTVVTHVPHQLGVREWFKTNGNMPVTRVLEIIDEYTFVATYKGGDAFADPSNVPRITYDITPQWTRAAAKKRRNWYSHKKTTQGGSSCTSPDPETGEGFRWWDGQNFLSGWVFEDDYDVVMLTRALPSDDYDPPPRNLRGLVRVNDKVLCGHASGNLYFSEPGIECAWPALYETYVSESIVALVPITSGLLVLTDGRPYVVHVTDPAVGVTVDCLQVTMPCLSKKSVVVMPYGIVWMSVGGLAVFRNGSVVQLSSAVIDPVRYMNVTDGPAWQVPCTDDVSLAAPVKPDTDWIRLFAESVISWFDGRNYVMAWAPAWSGGDSKSTTGMLSFAYEGDNGYLVRWYLSDGKRTPSTGASPAASSNVSAPLPTVQSKYVVDTDLALFDAIQRFGWDGSHPWLDKFFHGRKAAINLTGQSIRIRYDDTYAGLVSQTDVANAGAELSSVPIAKFELLPGTYMLSGSTLDKHTHQSGVDYGDNSQAPIDCSFCVVVIGDFDAMEYVWCPPYGTAVFEITPPKKINDKTPDTRTCYVRLALSRSFWADYERERDRGTPMVASKQYPITIDVTMVPKLVKLKAVPSGTPSTPSTPGTPGTVAVANRLALDGDDGVFTIENDSGSILLEDQTLVAPIAPPMLWSAGAMPQAVWYDDITGNTYCCYRDSAGGMQGAIIDLRSFTDANGARWKSKVLTLTDFHNIGAARVIADFPENNNIALVTFRLYVNKVLVAEVPLSNSLPFRLPTNYRADTFEVELTNIRCRVRAVHIAETMTGLKEA